MAGETPARRSSVAAVRDLVLVATGAGLVAWQVLISGPAELIFGGLTLLAAPLVITSAPVLWPDPPMPEGKRPGCVCRGCRRPGQRRLYERLLRRPIESVPRSHAQAILGITHGRLHDARRMEAQAGIEHSPEVILHFALPPERWTETADETRWVDFDLVRAGGCSKEPDMIAMEWR